MNAEDDIDQSSRYDFKSLSESQLRLLAILPIPFALFSILGSSTIIYMALRSRKKKPWTPYNRLLIGMSTFDVITSINLAIAAFLNPRDSDSSKSFAFGNAATCSAVGFINQIFYSGTFYNAMLSYYFLLTARFSQKNKNVSKRIEPAMHILSLGYPTVCAILGLVLDAYGESEVNIGCWVNDYPKGCGNGPGGNGEACGAGTIAWIFGGWIGVFTLVSLIINNFVIWTFVRKQIRTQLRNLSTKRSTTDLSAMDDDSKSNTKPITDKESSVASSFRTKLARSKTCSDDDTEIDRVLEANQKRRLRLVTSQTFLFVASYVICSFSTYLLRLYESLAATYVEEMELPYNNFILLVLQAILFPLQGLLNMLVYVRPKYLNCRSSHSRETRFWAVRRAILGSVVESVHSHHADLHSVGQVQAAAGTKYNVSSLTNASVNTEDSYKYGRRGDRSSESLGIISELSQEEDPSAAARTRTAPRDMAPMDINCCMESVNESDDDSTPSAPLGRTSSNPSLGDSLLERDC